MYKIHGDRIPSIHWPFILAEFGQITPLLEVVIFYRALTANLEAGKKKIQIIKLVGVWSTVKLVT